MKITERFKRVADDVVQYQITIDDPVTYARPFTISMPLTPLEGGVLLPYECHEGNLAIRSRSARSAPRTRRWPTIWRRGSSARAGRCRTATRKRAAAAGAAVRAQAAREPRLADVVPVRPRLRETSNASW